ncbi:MucR family transcriptional regulator [Alsobacter sp. KACC 23698]|uniref:MucR family transcriptional regulator n=1 Tax=Alsobacter sp. KACC 23698 TaxID=3149229 RepID=A0AAU7JIW7_9HYPH
MSELPESTLHFVADIVAAYLANNSISHSEIPALIANVHKALTSAAGGKVEEPPVEAKPAVSIKKSVTPDAIICLEDGRSFKSMKRHLAVKYGLTPAEYRAKWGLPSDYPMVAPNYAEARSTLARSMGLGRKPAASAPVQAFAESPAPRARRGRPPKAKAA